jgi:hypothetical protein
MLLFYPGADNLSPDCWREGGLATEIGWMARRRFPERRLEGATPNLALMGWLTA